MCQKDGKLEFHTFSDLRYALKKDQPPQLRTIGVCTNEHRNGSLCLKLEEGKEYLPDWVHRLSHFSFLSLPEHDKLVKAMEEKGMKSFGIPPQTPPPQFPSRGEKNNAPKKSAYPAFFSS